jgi:hypothetical protein
VEKRINRFQYLPRQNGLLSLTPIIGGSKPGLFFKKLCEVGLGAIRRGIGRFFLCNDDGREQAKKEWTKGFQRCDRGEGTFTEKLPAARRGFPAN